MTEFERVEKIKGIRCNVEHEGLKSTATAFPGTILDHMKEWHPAIYQTVLDMNEENTLAVQRLNNAKIDRGK